MKLKTTLFLFWIASGVFINSAVAQNKKKEWETRALYLSPGVLCDTNKVNHFIALTKKSLVNSYVINAKGEEGLVTYDSKIFTVRNTKACKKVYDISQLIRKFHQNHIHVIARVVCFNDPYLPELKKEWALKRKNGELYQSTEGVTWLNPVNKQVWKYLVDIAKESLTKGFDEIQFDYVRFPYDDTKGEFDFGEKVETRHTFIDSFLAYARNQMPKAILSADVFGIICQSVNDPENIGQNLEYVGKNLDFISPMLYPSLYTKGQIIKGDTFPKPDLKPYGVVYNSLMNAKNRIALVKNYHAKIRPYLQAYTASWLNKEDFQIYGAEQMKQQIKAANDAGCDQWIFWNEEGNYPENGFMQNR